MLYDFLNYASQYGGGGLRGIMITETNAEGKQTQKEPQKINMKPIDALNELETVPNPLSLMGLDEKIELLEKKEKLITQHYSEHQSVSC